MSNFKVTKRVKLTEILHDLIQQDVEFNVLVKHDELTDEELLKELDERDLLPECNREHVKDLDGDELIDRARDAGISTVDLIGALMHAPHVLEAIQDVRRGVTQGTIQVTPRIQELFLKIFETYI